MTIKQFIPKESGVQTTYRELSANPAVPLSSSESFSFIVLIVLVFAQSHGSHQLQISAAGSQMILVKSTFIWKVVGG